MLALPARPSLPPFPSLLCKAPRFVRPSRIQCRPYYSELHPDPPPFPAAQHTILSAALNHVPSQGFSSQALSSGAKDAGYLEVSVQLFPRGVYDLVNYHLVTQRLALKSRVQFPEDTKLGVGSKIRLLTLERLWANKGIIHQWQGVRYSLTSVQSV